MSAESDTFGQRRRLHKLTPLASSVPLVVGVALVTMVSNGGSLWTSQADGIPAGLLIVLVVMVATLVYRFVYWQRFTFWFDQAGDLRIDSGVFFRNERKVALSRLQAVDVTRPIVARLVGLAAVRIEVAGAGDKRVSLAYLGDSDAEAMREELLARAGRVGGEGVATEAAAPESIIAQVPPGRLFASLMIRTTTVWLLALTVLIVITTAITQGPAGLGVLVVTGGLPLFMVAGEFLTFYGFTVAKAHDGVRIRHGLLSTQAQTVPHGRVAAFDILEPMLWRSFGWVRLRITIAGGGQDSDDSKNSKSVLLPVGSREEALEVLSHVLAGVAVDDVPLTAAPHRSRWRAPIQWSKLAYGHDGRVFVARRGLITRRTSVVAHARTQSVSIVQGPYQRALGLSTLRIDVAPGPVKVECLYFPSGEMAAEAIAQAQRAREARLGDWASGPTREAVPVVERQPDV